MTVRVFIVATAPIERAGLRSMLAEVEGDGVRVVGEAASLAVSGLDPAVSEADVVLLADAALLEEAARLAPESGGWALMLLADDEREVSRLRSLEFGRWGVVTPDASPEEMGAAILAVSEGLITLPKSIAELMIPEETSVEDLAEPLTPREQEILTLLSQGLSNRQISGKLYISEHTVKFHISALYAKLAVSSRAEAVSRGARYGLISL